MTTSEGSLAAPCPHAGVERDADDDDDDDDDKTHSGPPSRTASDRRATHPLGLGSATGDSVDLEPGPATADGPFRGRLLM